MSELFTAFGVDWRLLLINIFNFGILLFGLWYFLYEPLTKMLESRREKVAEGVRNAELAAQHVTEIEESRLGILAGAGKEADTLLDRARVSGLAREQELVAAGESAAQHILTEAELQARELKVKALEESKQEVAKLVVLGMEKLSEQKV